MPSTYKCNKCQLEFKDLSSYQSPQTHNCVKFNNGIPPNIHENFNILKGGDLIYGIDYPGNRTNIIDARKKYLTAHNELKRIGQITTDFGSGTQMPRHGISIETLNAGGEYLDLPTADSLNNYQAEKKHTSIPTSNIWDVKSRNLLERHIHATDLLNIKKNDWSSLCKQILWLAATPTSKEERITIHFDLTSMYLLNSPTKGLYNGEKSITDQEFRFAYRLQYLKDDVEICLKGWINGFEVGMPWESFDPGTLQHTNRYYNPPSQMPGKPKYRWDDVYQAWQLYKPKMTGYAMRYNLMLKNRTTAEIWKSCKEHFLVCTSSFLNYISEYKKLTADGLALRTSRQTIPAAKQITSIRQYNELGTEYDSLKTEYGTLKNRMDKVDALVKANQTIDYRYSRIQRYSQILLDHQSVATADDLKEVNEILNIINDKVVNINNGQVMSKWNQHLEGINKDLMSIERANATLKSNYVSYISNTTVVNGQKISNSDVIKYKHRYIILKYKKLYNIWRTDMYPLKSLDNETKEFVLESARGKEKTYYLLGDSSKINLKECFFIDYLAQLPKTK